MHDHHPAMGKGGFGTEVSFAYQEGAFFQRVASASATTDAGRAPVGSRPWWSKPALKFNFSVVQWVWWQAGEERAGGRSQ